MQRFELTGSVKGPSKSRRRKIATDDEHSLDVMKSFLEDPHASLRTVAQEHDVHHSSVRNVLNHYKLKPKKTSCYKNYKKMIGIEGLTFVNSR